MVDSLKGLPTFVSDTSYVLSKSEHEGNRLERDYLIS